MDTSLFTCHSNGIDSLYWTESEVRSQSSISMVGDSQFPLSVPVCYDSQDIGVKCVRPDRLAALKSLKSTETSESFDMENWDLADGEVKSQNPGNRLRDAHTYVCPPPSLDTQEFEIRCIRSDDLPHENNLDSEKSFLHEMACWDLADGEAISQDGVRPLVDAETPPCPPASLDSEEFVRRYVEQDDIMSMEDSIERSSPDALELCDLGDGKTETKSLLKVLVPDNKSLCHRSSTAVQDVEVNITRREHVSSAHSLQLSEVAPGEEKSQRDLRKFYCDTETRPRLEYSLGTQEFASRWGEKENASKMKSVASVDYALDDPCRQSLNFDPSRSQSPRNVEYSLNSQEIKQSEVPQKDNAIESRSSAYSKHLDHDVRPEPPLSQVRSLVIQTSCAAAVQDEVHRTNAASSLDAPLTIPKPDTDGHRSKRKIQEPPLLNGDKLLGKTTKLSLKSHLSTSKRSSSVCCSPLRPLSVNSTLISDVKDEVYNPRQCHEPKVSLSKAEDSKNMAHVAVPEPFPSGQQYPTGKENVGPERILKEVGAAVQTTSTIRIKKGPRFDAGAKHVSSNVPRTLFQSLKQVCIHDVQPKSTIHQDSNAVDKRRPSSVQTQLSSRVGFTSSPAKLKTLVSEDHEQTQGWRCPKASKRILSKKPRQGFLDTWLK